MQICVLQRTVSTAIYICMYVYTHTKLLYTLLGKLYTCVLQHAVTTMHMYVLKYIQTYTILLYTLLGLLYTCVLQCVVSAMYGYTVVYISIYKYTVLL